MQEQAHFPAFAGDSALNWAKEGPPNRRRPLRCCTQSSDLMSDDARAIFLLRGRRQRWRGALLDPLDGYRRRDQSVLEQLIDGADGNDRQPLLHVVGNLGEILLVITPDQPGFQSATHSREPFPL